MCRKAFDDATRVMYGANSFIARNGTICTLPSDDSVSFLNANRRQHAELEREVRGAALSDVDILLADTEARECDKEFASEVLGDIDLSGEQLLVRKRSGNSTVRLL